MTSPTVFTRTICERISAAPETLGSTSQMLPNSDKILTGYLLLEVTAMLQDNPKPLFQSGWLADKE